MPPHVTLRIQSPSDSAGQSLALTAPARCIVGRDPNCALRLDDPRNPPQVSRKHCELIIEPPSVLVRDLDSANGTSINGRLLGSKAAPSMVLGRLFDGDTLSVADFLLHVRTSPVLCSGCLQAITDDSERRQTPEGRPLCLSCCNTDSPPTIAPAGSHLDAVQRLLSQAQTGVPNLLPLRDYAVERELGRGGMGAVYLARHLPTGRRVALKVMLPHLAAHDDLLARFQREIDNTRALCHPHIVTAFDSGREDGTYFFTMEYCEGGSLEHLLRRRGPLSVAEAVPLLAQVLDALAYAHAAEIPAVPLAEGGSRPARGLVHRDLKPSNLLLSAERTVKVADFGLAKAFELAGLSGHTRTGQVVCTPHFCPRQQVINSRDAGPEVDVWAAAACLYYLLTKAFVRDYPSGYDPLMAVSLQPVVPVRERRPDLPAALAEVIDRALVEEPAVPSWSAADFRAALLAATS